MNRPARGSSQTTRRGINRGIKNPTQNLATKKLTPSLTKRRRAAINRANRKIRSRTASLAQMATNRMQSRAINPAQPGKKSDNKSEQGEKSDKQGGKGNPSDDKQDGQPGTPGESQNDEKSDSEQDKSGDNNEMQSRKRVRQAEDRMREARKKLDEANRHGASDEQEKAIASLKEAKANLEELLRQLREEEIERVLASLESRFRKMLEMQLAVNEGTVRLDAIPEDERDHDLEIESGKLSRKESLITAEADKTLSLLREEGSSVAFPETVMQMREDMDQVTGRLARANVSQITQGIEQDIVKSLEEMIAALQKAQKEQQAATRREGGRRWRPRSAAVGSDRRIENDPRAADAGEFAHRSATRNCLPTGLSRPASPIWSKPSNGWANGKSVCTAPRATLWWERTDEPNHLPIYRQRRRC